MEELSQIALVPQGNVPNWLSGFLVRNGPVYEIVNGKQIFHWFDGLAMLHTFHFQNGAISYTNKYLRSDAYKAVFSDHSLNYLGFAVDPCRSLFKNFLTFFFRGPAPLQNANINVGKIADQYVAYFETPLPVRFDAKTLQTLGVFDYQDDLPKDRCWQSAHPHQEYNYLVEFGRKSSYHLYRMEGSARKKVAKVPVNKPAYMHSFSKTENFCIFSEYPYRVNPLDLLLGKKPFIFNYQWDPSEKTNFLVVAADGVTSFESEPFFAFHHVNAYEEGDRIIMDIICYKDAEIIVGIKNYFRPIEPFSDESSYHTELRRFTLERKTGSCHSKTLYSNPCEFPRINDRYDGKKYRYLYMVNALDNHSGPGLRPIYKFDHETLQTKEWSEKGCYPGEAVFVEAPDAQSEDDGVVLCVINNFDTRSSFLLILDAKSFEERARLPAPQQIPPGLHGNFLK